MNDFRLSLLVKLSSHSQENREFFFVEKQFLFNRISESLFRNSTVMLGFHSARQFVSFGLHRDNYKFVWGRTIDSRGQGDFQLRLVASQDSAFSFLRLCVYCSGKLNGVRFHVGVL